MPRYTYIAKPTPHQVVQGEIEAETEREAISKLTEMGYFPISVKVQDYSLEKLGFRQFWKISQKEIVLFTHQLSTLIESGVTIINSLNLISSQSSNKYLKAILSDVIGKIKDGKSLSEGLLFYPQIFSGLYTSMIHSGEVGGNINQSLKRLANFLEKEQEFRSSVLSALTYPFFILIVSISTVIVLLGFVIPRLVTMFEDMGQILPAPTKILITVSNVLRSYWWLILTVILIVIFLFWRIYQIPQGRILLDRSKLRLPILGKIFLKTEISRMMRTLSLLLSNGISILYSLDISPKIRLKPRRSLIAISKRLSAVS